MANKLFKDTAKTYYTFSQKTLRSTKQNDLKALKLKQKNFTKLTKRSN